MKIQLDIADEMMFDWKEKEMRETLLRGLYLLAYLDGKISIGKFSALMGMSYEEGRDWLHGHGISTLRKFNDPELEKAEEKNYRLVAKKLGIPAEKQG
jgi:predicted HTH domain antitoxin